MGAGYYFARDRSKAAATQTYGGFYRDTTDNYRDMLESARVMIPQSLPRVLLIDDDPTFGRLMLKAAKTKDVEMTYCKSLADFRLLKDLNYDVMIIDYDLGEVNGSELTTYIEQYSKEEIPTILVSQTNQVDSSSWAATIREFVHKRVGPFAILDAAFEAHEVNQIFKMVERNQ